MEKEREKMVKEQAELQEKIAELKQIVQGYVQHNNDKKETGVMKDEGSESTQPVKPKVCFIVYHVY